jgi:CHAT domain-containing protein
MAHDQAIERRTVPFASDELRAIRRAFPSFTDTLAGADARETAIRQALLDRFSIVHFATHGVVSETYGGRSGLVLSPEPGEDGLLQVSEVYGLGLRSDVVVLSACQTALGQEITGEGIVGLTRAFFYAGSRAVLATLWNLNDRFAADFVGRFYAELGTGLSVEDALRQTKLAYVNDPEYGHPFYWSAFVLTGDCTRAPAAGVPPDRTTLTALVVALLVVSAGAFLRYRRRVMEF